MNNKPELDYKRIMADSVRRELRKEDGELVEIKRADLDEVVRALLMGDRWMYGERPGEEDKYGGGPVRRAYILMVHPALFQYLHEIPGYISVYFYPDKSKLIDGEMGMIGNLRVAIDTSLQDYVINNGCSGIYHSIAFGSPSEEFDSKDYIVIKSR